MSGSTQATQVVDDALVEAAARKMALLDGESWDDPDFAAQKTAAGGTVREEYRIEARAVLDDIAPAIHRRMFDQLREASGNDADYMDTYRTFWQGIVEMNGQPVRDLVARELHDYAWLMEQVAEVYCNATGGAISKPNTLGRVVSSVIDDHYNETYNEDLKAERKGIYEDLVAALNTAGETRAAEIVRRLAANNPNGAVDVDDVVLATDLTQCGWRDPDTGAIAACDPANVSDPPGDGWRPVYTETDRARAA